MPKSSVNASLSSYDDIFSTEESRQEEQREQVQQIPIGELFPFKNHPFKVLDDDSMSDTVESVKQYGVLSPLIARPRPKGGYEIISGHRRQHAAELAGLETLPVIVRQMDDDAAIILMVDSNLQREHILPSERAFAYKMKLDAMKNQGTRSDLTSTQVVSKLRSNEKLGAENNQSRETVRRFIRLTNLIPELLDMVDNKTVSFNPAVELSYLSPEQQQEVIRAMDDTQNFPSVSQAKRMILEAIYEPLFLDCSHGFRPKRSCHTALDKLKYQFGGVRWFVEGDIKGCFDNINHDALVGFIGSKVKDARIVKLVYKFLKAGYLEDWDYHKTYSGTPQGGILSPLLANIYLHELDKFVMQLKDEFDTPEKGKITPEYRELHNRIKNLCYHIDRKNGVERESMIAECKTLRKQLLKTPCTAQTDKKLKYIRYADDFIIGVKGSKEDCQWIKSKLSEFIGQTLKMELSEEKTLITHSSECARFLGFDVRVRRCEKVKRNKKGTKARTLNNHVELLVPFDDKIHNFIFSKGIAIQKKDGKLFPVHRNSLLRLTDLEIVTVYNDELRGICNYYGIASNFCKLKYLSYLTEYSCLKTLAAKHKSKISKVVAMYKDGTGEWGIPYETKKKAKRRYFANYMDCKDAKISTDCISNAAIIYGQSVTPLEKRLKARICELCGTTESERYEIHHINKLKNLKGKEPWEIAMLAKRRKTLVVCEHCHHLIHNQ